MAIPASSHAHIRVNPDYSGRSDLSFYSQGVNRAKYNAQHYTDQAEQRPNTPTGQVWSQIDQIRAQNFVIQAEFTSHQVCPRRQEYNQLRTHQQEQIDRLYQLSMNLYGPNFNSLISNHGLYGAVTYASAWAVNKWYNSM